MQFSPFEPGIEVFGASIDAVVEGFALFPTIGLEKLAQHGIGEMRVGGGVGKKPEFHVERDAWYRQDSWLAAFEDISKSIGPHVLFKIGNQVPKHAPFPASIRDIHAGVKSLDVAYHMNHRKGGKVMFDGSNGRMLEGIGHYEYRDGGNKQIIMVCKNPYPCELDRGLIQAVSEKFERGAKVSHEKGLCRKNGSDTCTYYVKW